MTDKNTAIVTSNLVLLEVTDGVALVTLNRPDAYNALNRALSLAIVNTFNTLAARDDVSAIVLTGAGRAFCAGVDLKELATSPDVLTDGGMGTESPLVVALRDCGKPVIGAVNGAAVTGGFELALACDFLYAADTARFADTHARVGLLPGWGLSQKLSRLVGANRAREISFTGNFISAQQACDWGLVNKVFPADALLDAALTTAKQIAESNPGAMKAMRALMNDGAELALGEALALEGERGIAYLSQADFGQMTARLESLKARSKD
jgi:enoyl-CoA hydratase